MAKKNIKDMCLAGKTVLLRADFNVPLDENLEITNDNRIVEELPTIKFILEKDAKLVIFSHLGKVKTEEDKMTKSLKPVAKRLSELLGKKVLFSPKTRGAELEDMIQSLNPSEVLLVENTRFEKGETKNEEELGKYWASLGDVFVNDAFGTAHRKHASNYGIGTYLPTASGFLIEKEIKFLGSIENSERPLIAILGGAKVSDKIAVIENLIDKADAIIIGGGMMFTFLKAMGKSVGKSIVEEDKIDFAKKLIALAKEKNTDLLIPIDTVVADNFSNDAKFKTVSVDEIPDDMMGLDIGEKTLELFNNKIDTAKTIIWNGPMGVFEFSNFAKGTVGILEKIAHLENATTIIGGGDSAAAAIKFGYKEKFTHISTGGGASLKYLEGKGLDGISIIDEREVCRKPLIVGNWKMNGSKALIDEFHNALKNFDKVEVDYGMAVPSTLLTYAVDKKVHGAFIYAENFHQEESGAYTGEISADMLHDISVERVIIGHSERRKYFGETDEIVNLKLLKATEKKLKPIVCVGENLEEREAGKHFEVVLTSVEKAFENMAEEMVADVVIAYEPVWAIGTGKTATPEDAEEMCYKIREKIAKLYSEQTAKKIRIQYGGSVKPANIKEIMSMPNIDGALVGGASLKADDFIKLLTYQ